LYSRWCFIIRRKSFSRPRPKSKSRWKS